MIIDNVAAALGISAKAMLSPAPQGMTSEVAFVNDRGRQCVLKRCRHPIYIEWLRRERRVLDALSECSLHVPRLIGYHEVRDSDDVAEAWLLMTRLPGESLWQVLLRSGPVERRARFRKLGQLLRTLHSTPAPMVFRNQPPWIDRTLEQAQKNLEWCDGSAALLAEQKRTQPSPQAEVLIHGDLALDNVLIDQDGNLSLI